jgi:prophage regulatory protein
MTNDQTTTTAPKTQDTDKAALRILRLPEVMARVGLRRASIYQHMNDGSFPRSVSLTTRAIGWRESDIETWLASRCRIKPNERLSVHK